MNDDTIKKILEKYKHTFEALAEKDSLEYDVAEWLLMHKDGLLDKLKTLYRPAYHLFPPAMQDLYYHQYENGAIHIIQDEIQYAFQLDPETLTSRITRQFIRSIVPDLLSPPKEI